MRPVSIDLGNPAQNPTVLCSQDWYMPTGNPPWNFGSIRKLPAVTGPWMVDVQRSGRYQITLRQLPKEADHVIVADRARVQIAGLVFEREIPEGSSGVAFEMDLPKGKSRFQTWLHTPDGQAGGAYFAEVEWVGR
jgi:hypothetical protein